MAGSVRKILAYLGLADDEYSDYDDLDRRTYPRSGSVSDRYEDDYAPEPPRRASRPSRPESGYERDDAYQDPREPRLRPVPVRPVGGVGQPEPLARRGGGLRISPQPKETAGEVSTVAPRTFGDAKEIADHLKANRPVIVNLESADADLQRRLIDFCSGVAYALGCRMERIAKQIFLFSPSNVTVRPEDRGYGRFDG